MVKIKHEIGLLPMVFSTKSKLRKNGKGPLVIKISLNCKEDLVYLKKNVTPSNWNSKSKRVSKQEEDHILINRMIQAAEVSLNNIYDNLFNQYDIVTPKMIKNVFEGNEAIHEKRADGMANEKLTLIGAFDYYIKKFRILVEKGKRSNGSLRQWNSSKKLLIEYLSYLFKKRIEDNPDIEFKDISPDFADEMYDYLTLERPIPQSEATAKKHIKKLKQIINLSVRMGIIDTNPIAHFVCGGDTNVVLPLEWEDVEKIYSKNITCKRLCQIRDTFIFQCFTGFAYQDIYSLSPENIILVGPSKERWLQKHRGKTGVFEVVPILPIIEQLIDKYRNHPVCIERNSLMPVLSNVKYNAYLKELADLCGLNLIDSEGKERTLNTHLARHTFADIMLNLGMPLEDVSVMLGHNSIRTTQRYARVRKERIQKNFNEFVKPNITLGVKKVFVKMNSSPINVEFSKKQIQYPEDTNLLNEILTDETETSYYLDEGNFTQPCRSKFHTPSYVYQYMEKSN